MGGGFNISIDVSKNFDFVTNFGTYPITQLMVDYIFEGVFSCLAQFISLRLPMTTANHDLVRRVLKLCMMSAQFKAKPSHESILIRFVS